MSMRGRYYRFNKQATLSELLKLDIKHFSREIDLTKPQWGSWRWVWTSGRESSISYQVQPCVGIRLQYTNNKTDSLDYLVRITSTSCNFGGVRYWWDCPNCGRRCGALYSGRYFVCHRCSGYHYETQQSKDLVVRIDNEVSIIRRKLKATGNDDRIPDKPKRMQWRTYCRLTQRFADLQEYRVYSIGIGIIELGGALGESLGNAKFLKSELKQLIAQR